ncbi:MAG: peptide ligase PGM1-related protein [Cyanobacteria bacterium P01_H01_bin.15]
MNQGEAAMKSAQFEQLQNQLKYLWHPNDLAEQEDCDILVVPSFSVDQATGEKVPGFLHYEERLLFSLIRLRHPRTRLIYVTALPLSPLIIDYYLQLLPGIPFTHARDRLLLLSTYDNSLVPLTQKLLDRPRLLERLRHALRPGRSYMVCYNSTFLEQELSVSLGVPLLACPPSLLDWGSKSGSRQIFQESGLRFPEGSSRLESVDEVIQATADLWQSHPQLRRCVVKLNEGFSGEGNALLTFPSVQVDLTLSKRKAIVAKVLPEMEFQGSDETWSHFSSQIAALGAIVEAFIEGTEKRSPSVQGYITPTGQVNILSTHDQILGGPDGQIFLGCQFPADEAYRKELQTLGLKVGQNLAQKGVLERYGVDFIAVKTPTGWELSAIEINLRKGGTTHPFMTLKLLTNGAYDYDSGLFISQQGVPKYYLASDNLQKPAYRGLLPEDLMDIVTKRHIHFHTSSKTGTVFHLMGALSEFGKLGHTSIGDSPDEASALAEEVEAILDEESSNPGLNSCRLDAPATLPMTWV